VTTGNTITIRSAAMGYMGLWFAEIFDLEEFAPEEFKE